MQTVVAVRAEKTLEINGFDEAVKLAEIMSSAKLVPTHLQKSPADCLLVIEQAIRWGMSPFAVAQATSIVKGKLMFEGKLVAAAIQGSGVIHGALDYAYKGEGDAREVTVIGTLRGENAARTITAKLVDVRTDNAHWAKSPDQMLSYMGARIWARRHAPAVMLGVYAPDEFDDKDTEKPKAKMIPKVIVEQAPKAKSDEAVMTAAPKALPAPVAAVATVAPVAAPVELKPITADQLKEMSFLLKQINFSAEKKADWAAGVKKFYGVDNVKALTHDDADSVIAELIHEADMDAMNNNPFSEGVLVNGGAK